MKTEATRYINNAKDILKEKTNKADGYYHDKKYVKMAGHTAYTGVLLSLDSFFGIKEERPKECGVV